MDFDDGGFVPAAEYYPPRCMQMVQKVPVAYTYPMLHAPIREEERDQALSFWGMINIIDPRRKIPEGFEPLMQLRCCKLPNVAVPEEYALLAIYIGHYELHIEPFTHEELSALKVAAQVHRNSVIEPSKLVFKTFYREYPDCNDLSEVMSDELREVCCREYPHYEGCKCGGYPSWNQFESLSDFEGSNFLLQIDMLDVEGYEWMETTTFHIFYYPDKKIFHCNTSMF